MLRITFLALVLSVFPVQAQQRFKVLPPEEFDRPYEGTLVLIRAQSEDEVRRYCPQFPFPLGALGCARWTATECTIIVAPEEAITARGFTVEQVLRHERAHCGGRWPAWHPGAR